MISRNTIVTMVMQVPELYYRLVPPNLQPTDCILTRDQLTLTREQLAVIDREGNRFCGRVILSGNRAAALLYMRFLMSLIYIRTFDGNAHRIAVVVPNADILQVVRTHIENDVTLTTYGRVASRWYNDIGVGWEYLPHGSTPGLDQYIVVATTDAMAAIADGSSVFDTVLLYQEEDYPNYWFDDVRRRVYAMVRSQPNYLLAVSTWTPNISIEVFGMDDVDNSGASAAQPAEESEVVNESDGSVLETEGLQSPMDDVNQIDWRESDNTE